MDWTSVYLGTNLVINLLSGVVVTDDPLWVDTNRNFALPVDVYELRMGLSERAIALQNRPDPLISTVNVETNKAYTWGATAYTWTNQIGTNQVATAYLYADGQTDTTEVTNQYFIWGYDFFSLPGQYLSQWDVPIYYDMEAGNSNRWISGGYEYVAAGSFTGGSTSSQPSLPTRLNIGSAMQMSTPTTARTTPIAWWTTGRLFPVFAYGLRGRS